jgi:polysaccharide biosynthesis protein PslH
LSVVFLSSDLNSFMFFSLPMNILYIVPYTPNLIRVRSYNLIRNLAMQGHEVTVMTLGTNEESDVENLKKYCQHVYAYSLPAWRSFLNVLLAVPTNLPLQSVYGWCSALARDSINLVDSSGAMSPYDVIHIEHLRGVRYGLHLKNHLLANNVRIPIIWDSVDCITYLFEQAASLSKKMLSRWLTSFELGRTRRYEGYLINQFDQVLVSSKVDKNALIALNPSKGAEHEISVLPNGVDLAYFKPDKTVIREEATLVVSGKMSYHANVTMVLYLVSKIMPIVWERKPDVKLWIVGKDPSTEIKALASNPAITVTGAVKDIRPYLQSATIAVAPLIYGAGIQLKILEAMACATPVITTPQAILGLSAHPERDLLIAGDPVEFAEKILDTLDRPDRQRELGECGCYYVEKNHNWEDIAAQLAEIYANCKRIRYDVHV